MKSPKISLVGKSLDDLINICETYDVEKFRAEQIFNWVYKNKVNDFKAINNIPKDFINTLSS